MKLFALFAIKGRDAGDYQAELMAGVCNRLSERQSQAILDMRLRRLTGLNAIKFSQNMMN